MERTAGGIKYLLIYLLGGLGGNLLSLVLEIKKQEYAISAGASGAIFGVLGALMVTSSRTHLDLRQLIVLTAINLVMPLFVPDIAWQAHIGGLLTGAGTSSMLVGTTAIRRVLNYRKRTIITMIIIFVVIAGVVLLSQNTSTLVTRLSGSPIVLDS